MADAIVHNIDSPNREDGLQGGDERLAPGSHEAASVRNPAAYDHTGASPVLLQKRGRWLRISATVVVLSLALCGTLFGQDSHFPVGPFRMFSTRDDPNGSIIATELEAITQDGKRLNLTGSATGIRRAEVEGQLSNFVHNPETLATVADRFKARNPAGPTLQRIEVVRHEQPLRHGRPTGEQHTVVLASWELP